MKTLSQILKEKSAEIITVRPNDSVYVALQVLATYNVGALPVVSGDGLVGIFSERDYARKVALKGLKSESTEVHEVMTSGVICADLTMSVLDCMQLMSGKKIRHLPVMDHGHLIGILSIGDLVKAIIEAQQFQIEQLEQYIKS
jgi:CBS domain-containing protein